MPHLAVDPVVIGAETVLALQAVVSRGIDPFDQAVITVSNFNAGTGARNVIPSEARLVLSVRAFKEHVRSMLERRIKEVAQGVAAAHGAQAQCEYVRNYDPTVNSGKEAEMCRDVGSKYFRVDSEVPPSMGAEDFGAMLQRKPGCYVWIGQGTSDNSSPCNQGLHSPRYDFNDEILPGAIAYFCALAESALS